MNDPQFLNVAEKIRKADSIILTTHRQCDGDGLGAQIGLYHALKSLQKNVRILNVDATPEKYQFLQTDKVLQTFDAPHDPIKKSDLAIILDTNDYRLLEPLYPSLESQCKEIIFIDHHPILEDGPAPTADSYIDEKCASTGEIAFRFIKELGVAINFEISQAIYTSIAFDTHLFRFVRESPSSHLIAAELLQHKINPAEIHRLLFANHSIDKIRFLSHLLEKTEYFFDGQLAVLQITEQELRDYNMTHEDSRDLIDFLMNIDTLIVGATIREDELEGYRISLRSKGRIEVRPLGEILGGGGHMFASGATSKLSFDEIKTIICDYMKSSLTNEKKA